MNDKEIIIMDFIKKEGYASQSRILFQCNFGTNNKITKSTLNSLVKKGLLTEHKNTVGLGGISYSITKP
jgi:predicted transcriptional regulator